jgi:hypothetical protein
MPRIHRVGMSPVNLDPRFGMIRTPTRHPISRQEGFEDLFDFFTLFYDIFWSVSGDYVIALGPPLPKALDHRRGLQITALPSGTPCQFHYRKSRKPPLPCRLEIAVPVGTHALVIDVKEQSWTCGIQPNLSSLFDGRVALVTISRDNHLQWIRDWARYHAAECEVDTVVFYDNGTRSYELGDVALALSEVDALKDVVLIQQEALFGPVGFPAGGGPSDSAFLKPAMFEHARHRLLSLADLYINLDIDELLLPQPNRKLRDYLDRDEPVALIDRKNVENYSTAPIADQPTPRHGRYWWRKKQPSSLLPKWIAQPRRCSPDSIFTYHQVEYERMWRCPEDELAIAHFLGVTTGWKEPDRLQQLPSHKVSGVIEDIDLRDRLARVIAAEESDCRRWTPFDSGDASLMLRWAREHMRENRLNEAEGTVVKAIETDPNLLGGFHLLQQLHILSGDAVAADAVQEQINRLTIHNPDWYFRRANYIRRKDVNKAEAVLETAVERGVESPQLWLLLGEIFERVGRNREAADAFERTLVLAEPDSPQSIRAEEGRQRLEKVLTPK